MSCPLSLQLVEKVSSSNDNLSFISADGYQLYSVHEGAETGSQAATLFENNKPIASVPVSLSFSIASSGAASNDFSLFSVIDENGVDKAQIKIYTQESFPKNEPITMIDIDNIYGSQYSANGGVFTSDNKFMALTYNISGTPDNQGIFSIYDVKSGKLIDHDLINGFSLGPVPFSLNGKQYIAVGYSLSNFSSLGRDIHGPSFMSIYRLKVCKKRTELIKITTCQLDGLPVIAVSPDSSLITVGLQGNNPGLYLYIFNGKHLKCVDRLSSDMSIDAIGFRNNSDLAVVYFINGQSILTLYHIVDNQLKIIDRPYAVSPATISSNFSKDGKWLLTSGTDEIRYYQVTTDWMK